MHDPMIDSYFITSLVVVVVVVVGDGGSLHRTTASDPQ
jgi:hypothetical protein